MKKKLSIAFILAFMVTIAYGQKLQKGSITLTDGTVKKGLVEVPGNYIVRDIAFKANDNAKEEKIEADKISSLTVYSDDGKPYVFENRYTVKRKGKLTKHKYLLLKVSDGYADLYFSGNAYKADKEGNVMTKYSYYVTKDLPTFIYYIRKKGEENFSVLGMTSTSPTMFGLNKLLKKNAEELLADDKPLLKKIEDGEYKHDDIPEIIKVYNKDMGKK